MMRARRERELRASRMPAPVVTFNQLQCRMCGNSGGSDHQQPRTVAATHTHHVNRTSTDHNEPNKSDIDINLCEEQHEIQ